MQVSGYWVFGLGCFGGILVELYKWWQLRESANFPLYAKSVIYWGLTIAMVVAGGVVAILYGTDDVNAILAVNIGASAPAIIRTLATTVPPLPPAPAPAPAEGQAPSPSPAPTPPPPPSLANFLATR